MKMRTISKLLATSIFALTALTSQAANDVDVMFSWDTSPNSYGVQHGDFYPHENHEADTKHNNKYKMFNIAGVSWKNDLKNHPSNIWPEGDPNVVRWGYGGWKKGKDIDFTRRSGSDDYRTSGLVINNAMNEITYWNNFLDEDFFTLTFVTLNIAFTVNGETVVSPLTMFIQRENEKQKKNGTDVDHGGSFLIFDADLTFTHNINGVQYVFTFDDMKITDVYGKKDITAASLYYDNDCRGTGLSSCYIIDGKIKKSTKNTEFLISFGDASVVPEPETYAMMLAGLGLVGIVARRRRNTI